MCFVRFFEETEIIFLYSCKLLLTYLLTYSMEQSPSEKLIGSQIVKKFPAYYGTRKSVTTFTSARHLSLSWARSIQFMPLPIPLLEDPS
jgi:hypothetical protein